MLETRAFKTEKMREMEKRNMEMLWFKTKQNKLLK